MTVVIFKVGFILLYYPFARNTISSCKPIDGKKKGAFYMGMNIKDIKVASKKLGCTVNDFTTAILSNTIYEYFQRHSSENP